MIEEYVHVTQDEENHTATEPVHFEDEALDLWHERIRHIHKPVIREMQKKQSVLGLKPSEKQKVTTCKSCLTGKMSNTILRARTNVSNVPGAVIHTDVCTMDELSIRRSKYFVTFTDECTGYIRACAIQRKSDTANHSLSHTKWVERQTGNQVKRMKLDGGGEYEKATDILRASGVEIDISAPYTPNENGRAERQNRTLLNSIPSMLHHAGLPREFWAEALQVAIDVRNMVPKTNKSISPFEGLHGIKPSVEHLKTFGCEVYCRVSDSVRRKLDPKSVQGILMRVISYGKYRVYIEKEHSFTTTLHARINEAVFPARDWTSDSTSTDQSSPDSEYEIDITQMDDSDRTVGLLFVEFNSFDQDLLI